MMLTEETIKKLWLWGMVAVLVIGLFWLVFVFMFNRGSIRLEGEPSYRAEIVGTRSDICTENPCIIEVAPGDYTIRLTKEGYMEKVENVSVPLGGEAALAVEFSFQPSMAVLGAEEELGYFAADETAEAVAAMAKEYGLPEKYSLEENYLVYLARNSENGRQTLYYRDILEGGATETEINLGEEKIAASFVRDLKEWDIYAAIEESQKIAVVDKSNNKSVLYLVDLKEKTRNNILEHALISDLKWMPGGDKLLYEARDLGSQEISLYSYDTVSGSGQKLGLNASLRRIGFIDGDRVFAALSGTPAQFAEYNLASGMTRTILTDSTEGEVEEVKMSSDRRAAFILKQGTVYELRFEKN